MFKMNRLKLIFVVLFTLILPQAFAKVVIVSDLDDTIKITNVGSAYQATVNGVFKKNVFSGMPEFLKEARAYSEDLHVLTASPSLIYKNVHRTLNDNKIKFTSLFLRNILKDRDSYKYKIGRLKYLMDKSDDEFILIGDDANHDPEIYDEIKNLYPNKVMAIYINVIRGRVLPITSQPYYTAADLALRELEAGRMGVESARSVLATVSSESKLRFVRPSFAECPRDPEIWGWQAQTVLAIEAAYLAERVSVYCSAESQQGL